MTQLEKLSIFFEYIWEQSIEGWAMDIDLENVLQKSELGEWILVTKENMHSMPEGLEDGDSVMGLNDDGKEIIAIAKRLKQSE